MNNVTKLDILEIENQIGIHLTPEQRVSVLMEYNTVCMDKAEGWDELIGHLIIKQATIQTLLEKNK